MAEDSDLERTEPASQRRLEQARQLGQVPRSAELASFAVLMAAGGGLTLLGGSLGRSLADVMRAGLTLDRAAMFDPAQMSGRLYHSALTAALGSAPLLLLVIAVSLLAPMLLGGWLFTFQALVPDLSRLNPLAGLRRIFSWYGLIELGKAALKIAVVACVALAVVWSARAEILGLANEPLEPAIAHLVHLLGMAFVTVAGALLLAALIDVPLQIWDHARQLRMTREEVRQELQEAEGNPQIRAHIRAMQRAVARRGTIAAVTYADVVVTDAARHAVALRYRKEAMRAPRVVAKGARLVAERIERLARESHVPVLRSPPLARALSAHAQVGQDVPGALYPAVAEVLAWVYQLRRFESLGGEAPRAPAAVAVPPERDPGEEAAIS